jgi:hypothetical protein
MCINEPMPQTDRDLQIAKTQIQADVARAAGVSRTLIPIEDMVISEGCNSRRRQTGYTVAFDILDTGDYAAERPINTFRKLMTQSNDPDSLLRTEPLTKSVVPGSLSLVCQVGCDGKQVCAQDTVTGAIDSSKVLIVDPYGTCGGTGWCDGIANSGDTACPEFTPVPTYTPLSGPEETRAPDTPIPRPAPATTGPSLAPLDATRAPTTAAPLPTGDTREPTEATQAPTAAPLPPGETRAPTEVTPAPSAAPSRPVPVPGPTPGSPAGNVVASWLTVAVALLACFIAGH